MQKFLLTILAAFALSNSSFAQISLDDLIKEFTDSVGTTTITKDSTGASPSKSSSTSKPASPFIEAVSSELSIIRQQYRLKRDGEYFGKNHKPFYGETYSLGIKVAGGLLLLDDVVEPWKDDEDYKRVNASEKYDPVYFWSYRRTLADTAYKAVDLELGTEYTVPVNNAKSLFLHMEAKSDFGLTMDYTSGKKSGMMIWAYANTNVQDSAMSVYLQQAALELEVKADSTLIPMSPCNREKIIGGLYVIPKYERGGRVQYLLAGAAVKTSEGKWGLQLLVKGDALTKSESDNASSKKSESKKRKKKSNK